MGCNLRKLLYIFTILIIAAISLCQPFIALANEGVAQGYKASKNVLTGMSVSLVENSVVPANTENQNNLLGVVVSQSSVTVALSTESNQAQVVTSGVAKAFVSNINGDIVNGDALVPSPIEGVLMKATENGPSIGNAQQNFDVNAKDIENKTIKAKDGSNISTSIGTISILISRNDFVTKPAEVPRILSPFQSIFTGFAGHNVSTTRTVISVIIFALAVIAAMIVMYAGVSNGIRSIGRNPLSKGEVYVGLMQVFGIILLILTIALIFMLLIIKG